MINGSRVTDKTDNMQALCENNAVRRGNLVSICGRRSLLKAHAYIMHVKSSNISNCMCNSVKSKSVGPVIYFVMVVFLKSRLVSFS